jgi:hypothetical protein
MCCTAAGSRMHQVRVGAAAGSGGSAAAVGAHQHRGFGVHGSAHMPAVEEQHRLRCHPRCEQPPRHPKQRQPWLRRCARVIEGRGGLCICGRLQGRATLVAVLPHQGVPLPVCTPRLAVVAAIVFVALALALVSAIVFAALTLAAGAAVLLVAPAALPPVLVFVAAVAAPAAALAAAACSGCSGIGRLMCGARGGPHARSQLRRARSRSTSGYRGARGAERRALCERGSHLMQLSDVGGHSSTPRLRRQVVPACGLGSTQQQHHCVTSVHRPRWRHIHRATCMAPFGAAMHPTRPPLQAATPSRRPLGMRARGATRTAACTIEGTAQVLGLCRARGREEQSQGGSGTHRNMSASAWRLRDAAAESRSPQASGAPGDSAPLRWRSRGRR